MSFFVHADFLTAFKAAPQCFWDYFHKSYPRHPIEQDKGYGREWFDCQMILVKKAEEKAFAKIHYSPVDLKDPIQALDRTFYTINHKILQTKGDFLEDLKKWVESWEEKGWPCLTEYFQYQNTRVNIFLIVYLFKVYIFLNVLFFSAFVLAVARSKQFAGLYEGST